MLLGFAITQHCNLRCPHCIRDDVTTVRSLSATFVDRVVGEAVELWGEGRVRVSLTGGEPLVHPDFGAIVGALGRREVPWTMVSNGWHMARALPHFAAWPPHGVRLSLSGADRATHDAERGRGSFDRVLTAVALLTSRRIPTSLSIVIDARDLDGVEEAAALAEGLGCAGIHFILPQPVEGSAERGSDLPPEAWVGVRRRVEGLARIPGRRTAVILDYGAPFEGPEEPCATLALERFYVDARGRVCTCCQLSDYGGNDVEVVADLNRISLAAAWDRYRERIRDLTCRSAPPPGSPDPFDRFPCMRCARASGKLDWLARYPSSPWHPMAPAASAPGLVQLTMAGAK
jgi:MoaA/NifB/PqqE/SkfB family radical SAM enzyme